MKLEVLPAREGDCLLIHADDGDRPGLILVDGGPAGVARDTLIPRLEALREEQGLDDLDPLLIDLVVVSHVDGDHVTGVVDLFQAMLDRKNAADPPVFRVGALWHNTFDHIVGNDQTAPLVAAAQFGPASTEPLVEEADPGPPTDHATILASIPQGDALRRLADELVIPVNAGFAGGLIQTAANGAVEQTVAGVKFTVVGPRHDELAALQKDFDKWLETRPPEARTPASLLSSLDDTAVANLSSIVLLAEAGGTTILLTGDARSDKVLEGLADSGLCGDGETMEVTVLKMPHHGSIRNLDDAGDFLRRVTSGNYVFSASGRFCNPDRATFELLLRARPGAGMKLYFTYPLATLDAGRQKAHEATRMKRANQGKDPGPEWSDATDGLTTLLSNPPPGVTVVAGDGGRAGSLTI